MGRCRSRIHYNELRRFDLAKLGREALAPVARWEAQLTWADGASITVVKRDDATLTFAYRAGEQDVSYDVPLAFAPRHLGGAQVYMNCPHCGRRCLVLRFVGAGLRCQRCTKAIYRTQSVDAAERGLHRYRKLRARLRPGTESAGLSYFPRRPKWMRRATYAKIKETAKAALQRYEEREDERLVRTLGRLMAWE